jgi:hypothetical protein
MNELRIMKLYEYYGISICKAEEKTILNRNKEQLYLDLYSLANALNLTYKELLEFISYSQSLKGNLAYYRNTEFRVIKVFHVQGISELYKILLTYGVNSELLNTTRLQLS